MTGAPGTTPGPWAKDDAEKLEVSADVQGPRGRVASGWVTVWNPKHPTFCAIVVDLNRPNVWNDELLDANARLIAAAPEMFEALAFLADAVGRFQEVGPLKGVRKDLAKGEELARAALARARGEQP